MIVVILVTLVILVILVVFVKKLQHLTAISPDMSLPNFGCLCYVIDGCLTAAHFDNITSDACTWETSVHNHSTMGPAVEIDIFKVRKSKQILQVQNYAKC